MHDVVIVEVAEPGEDLAGVEDDGGFVVLQGSPLGAQQGREAAWRRGDGGDTEWGSTPNLDPTYSHVSPFDPQIPSPALPTSRHLLHEDLDEAVLADGAQVPHDVPVPQVLVQGDLLVQGLRVPAQRDGVVRGCPGSPGTAPPPPSWHPPAVPLRDLLDSDAHLVVEAAPGVDDPERPPAQDHPLARLRVLVAVL